MPARSTIIRANVPRGTSPAPLPIPGGAATYDPIGIAALMGLLPENFPTTRRVATDRTLLGLPAANSAVQRIANNVALMMVGADAVEGLQTIEPTPVVLSDPYVAFDSFTYWKMLVSTALMRGNAIGIQAAPDEDGYATQVVPVPMDAMHAEYDPEGWLRYELNGNELDPARVVHVRVGVTLAGVPWTIGVIEAFRTGIADQLSQQAMAGDVWRAGAVPSGHVQIDVANPTAEQAAVVKANWVGNLGGRRTVAVTGKNMTYTPVSWSADDAQFIESRQFTVAETALMFGLRPEDLGAVIGTSSGTTYGNRTDDAVQRIVDAYTPVMVPFEQQWTRLLPGRQAARGNPEALLRSTTKERYEIHKLAQEIGLEDEDETRALNGKSPRPKADPPPPPEGGPDNA
jgi:HK97 family phage portal protein